MTNSSADDWRKLGRLVYQARIKAGYSDTKEWSNTVGRSSRMLLGLERGEAVGNRTLDLVAATLDWAPDFPYQVLEGQSDDLSPASVGGDQHDEPEFEFLTRVREDLTADEMDQLMKEATPYLEMLVRDIKNRNRDA